MKQKSCCDRLYTLERPKRVRWNVLCQECQQCTLQLQRISSTDEIFFDLSLFNSMSELLGVLAYVKYILQCFPNAGTKAIPGIILPGKLRGNDDSPAVRTTECIISIK